MCRTPFSTRFCTSRSSTTGLPRTVASAGSVTTLTVSETATWSTMSARSTWEFPTTGRFDWASSSRPSLGYDRFTVDDEFTRATAAAVKDSQDDLGRSETGTVTTDQIRYAPGPVRVDSHVAESGAMTQPGAAVLKTTGTAVLATVVLDVDDQRLARRGAAVEVTLPDGTTAAGRITGVETVIEPGQGNEQDITRLEVTVAFAKVPQGFDGAAVSVAFTAARRANVLVVPVSALLALAEGGYGLEVVEAGGSRIVAVRTGLFADGRVEVSGPGLRAGLEVGVPT